MTPDLSSDGAKGPAGLTLVATPIGNLADLSARAVDVLRDADVICCEDTRHSGRLLKHAGIEARRLMSLHAANEADRVYKVLQLLSEGKGVALISDAGTPLASDPGERLVASVIAAGFPVSLVPGPFAGVAAMVLSGFGTARWTFEGFLPRKGPERRDRLTAISTSAIPTVVYESPRRVRQTLMDLIAICGGDREVAVARELTKLHEEVLRGSLGDLVDHPSIIDALGEFAIVLSGAPTEQPVERAEIESALRRVLAAGLSRHDAVRAVEILLEVPHREVYSRALGISDSQTSDNAGAS